MSYNKTVWAPDVLLTPARLRNLESQHEKALVDARAASGNPLIAELSSSGPAAGAARMYFNTTDDKFYVSDGATWHEVGVV